MAVLQISQTVSNFTNNETDTFTLSSVAAQVGDLIVYTIAYRDTPGTNDVNTPTWNGESFTLYNYNTVPYHRVKTFTRFVTSATTANVVCTSTTTAFLANASVRVYRGVSTIDTVQFQTEVDSGGTWAAPSLVVATSMASGDMVESIVSKSGWDAGFGTPTTTFSPGGSSTLYSSTAHTDSAVGDLTISYLAATGTPTISWTASDGNQPVYYHHLMVMRAAAGTSIDTYPATVRSGDTGVAYTTTGLSTVSSITIGALAATSISDTSGDGTHSIPTLVDGVAHELYGTKTVTITGTGGSPTTTTSFQPLNTQSFVTLSGTLNTTNTGVLYNFSPAAVVGDQVVYTTATATVGAQGNLTTDFIGTQTMWHIDAATKTARSYSVVTGTGAGANGVSVSLQAGTPTASGSALTAVFGSSLSLLQGTPVARGSAVTTPLGRSVSLVVGTVSASGGAGSPGNATPSGVSMSLQIGTSVGTGSASVSPSGVSVSLTNGTPVARGSAVVQAVGVVLSLVSGFISFPRTGESPNLPTFLVESVSKFRIAFRKSFRKK